MSGSGPNSTRGNPSATGGEDDIIKGLDIET